MQQRRVVRERPRSVEPAPVYMSKDQVGQQLFIHTPERVSSPWRSSLLKRFDSSATKGNSDSPNMWAANYLTELRSNRPVRPSGSRPPPATTLPERKATRTSLPPPPPAPRFSFSTRTPAVYSKTTAPGSLLEAELPDRNVSAVSHRRVQSAQTDSSSGSDHVDPNTGRPLVRSRRSQFSENFLVGEDDATVVKPSGTYLEGGQRWMERQEAHSLREALHDMDIQKDESLYSAAQDEASRLVLAHQHPEAVTAQRERPYSYRDHLRKGSHARAQSAERAASIREYAVSISRAGSRVSSGTHPPAESDGGSPEACNPKVHELWDSPQKKAYMNMTNPKVSAPNPERKISGRQSRNISGGSLFRNPEDQIYEEPEEMAMTTEQQRNFVSVPDPLTIRPQNSAVAQFAEQSPPRSNTAPVTNPKPLLRDGLDFAPRQSRNPVYTTNQMPTVSIDPNTKNSGFTHQKQANEISSLEIRGDDIKEATSVKLKDRSQKLPTPAVVSDKPGRPIVSFDPEWRQKSASIRSAQSGNASGWRQGLSKRFSVAGNRPGQFGGSSRQSIHPAFRNDPPSMNKQNNSINSTPAINVPDQSNAADSVFNVGVPSITEPTSQKDPKPFTESSNQLRPWLHHTASAPVKTSTPHFTPSGRRPTASCAQCQLPIAGRIVSAAGERFHPECFTCFNCGEGLECVAFYPEPEQKREARIDRIRSRNQGIDVPREDGQTEHNDGDESLRFFCHLDFHELFSPRCRSCKTPIEGEVVVACGGEWHVGHFFCAECGDVSLLNRLFL